MVSELGLNFRTTAVNKCHDFFLWFWKYGSLDSISSSIGDELEVQILRCPPHPLNWSMLCWDLTWFNKFSRCFWRPVLFENTALNNHPNSFCHQTQVGCPLIKYPMLRNECWLQRKMALLRSQQSCRECGLMSQRTHFPLSVRGQELLRGSFRGTHAGLGGHVQNSTVGSNSHLEISHGVIWSMSPWLF